MYLETVHNAVILRSFNSYMNLLACRELHKATSNFTALVGQGAFGPVYKAVLQSTGTTLAVKVLAEQSKQGDKEFQNEVRDATSLVLSALSEIVIVCLLLRVVSRAADNVNPAC